MDTSEHQYFEASKFCKTLNDEYSKLFLNHEVKNDNKSTNKTFLNLSKGDQTNYPHFKPHIFLIEDIAESLDLSPECKMQKDSAVVPSQNTYDINNKSNINAEQIIADHSKTELWSPTSDQVIITQGEDDANTAIIRAMCEPGDNVVIATPGNPKIAGILKSYGVEVREFPINYITSENKEHHGNTKKEIDNWEYNVLNLAKLIDSRTKFVYVRPLYNKLDSEPKLGD